MSKLAVIRQYQTSPAAGGLLSFIPKALGKVLPKVFPSLTRAGAAAAKIAKSPVGSAAIAGATYAGAEALMRGGGGGASGGWTKRRSRGITARELRGYRKVANLIHKEGMVSRRARGRKCS